MKVEKFVWTNLRHGRVLLASLLVGLLTAPAAMAGPEDGRVVRGSGDIVRTDPNTTTINQFTQNVVIDWTSFNVASNETVNFVQPNSTATALNRIWDQNPSTILGSVNANGRIILVNPNGIVFGEGASVDVGTLIASGLDINADDFMNGAWDFANADGSTGGMVINHGLLQAAEGGSVSLFGGAVSNTGTIIANYGSINLAAGNQVTVDFDGDGLVQFAVDGAVIDNAHGVDSAVSNSGTLHSQGGTILLSANAAQNVFAQVVNNEGVVAANGVTEQGGRVFLSGRGGNVVNSGTITANSRDGDGGSVFIESDADTYINDGVISATSENATGGDIDIHGNRVALLGDAVVDASGATGGGTINIGGAYQGGIELPSAQATVIAPDVIISANAKDVGDGGVIIVWADGVTRFYGSIFARGGANGGDGGFVETSGHEYLESFGSVDATAVAGAPGVWLLDPRDVTIDSAATSGGSFDGGNPDTFTPTSDDAVVDVSDIVTALDGGTSVVITTGTTGTQNGDITIAAAIITSTPSLVTLQLDAARDIIVNAGISDSGSGLNLDFNAGRSIDVNASMSTGAGYIDLDAAGGGITLDGIAGGVSTLVTTSGNIILNAGAGEIADSNNEGGGTGANIETSTGAVSLAASSHVGTAGGGSEDLDLVGVTDLTIVTGGELGISNTATLTDLDITISGAGAMGNDASIVSTGLVFNIDEDGGDVRITEVTQTDLNFRLATTETGVDIDVVSGAIDVGAGNVTLDAQDAAITDRSSDTNEDITTTGTVTLTAADGIGSANAIDLSASNLTATATTGNVQVNYTGAGTLQADTMSTSSGAVTLTSAGGSFLIDSISASGLVTLTATAGSIDEDAGNDAAADIVGGSIDINAASGVGGTTALELTSANIDINNSGSGDIDVTSLATEAVTVTGLATVTGSISFAQTGGFSLGVDSANSTNGGGATDSVNISNDNGELTVATATIGGTGDINLATTTAGDVRIDDIDATGDTVTINAFGAIVDDDADGTADVIAASLDANAGTSIDIDTTITTLTGSSSGTGDVTIQETDGLALGAFTNSDGAYNITTAGAITTSGDVTATSISLVSGGNNISISETVTGSGGVAINAGAGTFTNVSDATDFGTVSNGGGAAAITITADAFDLQTGGGAGDSAINAGTGTASFLQSTNGTSFSLGTATTNTIVIDNNELGTITAGEFAFGDANSGVFEVGAVSLGASDITIVTGSTIDDVDDLSAHLATTGTLSLTSSGAIGGSTTLNTDASTIDVTATGGNTVNITDAGTNPTIFSAGSTSQVAAVSFTQTTNDIEIGLIDSSATVDLTATAGSINDAQDDTDAINPDITGTTITLTAQGEIGSNPTAGTASDIRGAIEIASTSLVVNSTTAGNIALTDIGGTTLSDIDATSGSIEIFSDGDLLIGDIDGSSLVNIQTTGGSINEVGDDADTANPDVTGTTVRLIATTGVGGNANDGNATDTRGAIEVSSTSLVADTSTSGDVILTDVGGTVLNDIDSAGNVDILSDGDLRIGNILATGSVLVETSAGSINDSADDSVTDVTGTSVTLVATDEIGGDVSIGNATDARAALEIVSTGLTLNSQTAGDIVITDVGGTTLTDLDAASGNIDIASDGDLEIGDILASGTVDILTSAGSINDAADDSATDISGTTVTLTASDEIGGVPTAGTATDTRGAIEIASTSLVANSTTAGNLVLTDVGGTTLTDLDATSGNIDILSDSSLLIGVIDASGLVKIQTSGGSINDAAADPDATTDITAASVDLDATTGIGDTADIDLSTASIAADTTGGDVNLNNIATTAVTASSLTTSGANISYTQIGGQSLATTTTTTTTSGDVTLDNDGAIELGNTASAGNLGVTAGGLITQGGGTGIDVAGNASFITDVDDMSITLGNPDNDVDGSLSFTTQTTSLNGGDVTYVNGDPGTENDTLTVIGSTVAGSIAITADDNITVAESGIDVSGGAGNTVSLVSTNGDLLDASPGSDTSANVITGGGQVSLTAGGSIGSGVDPADFDVSSTTDLALSAGGDVFVSNDVALSSFALTWTPSGNVFSLGGATTISLSDDATNTTLATVDNAGATLDFSLTTTSGDLYIDDGAISNINAGTVTLTAQAGSILDSDLADVAPGISIGNGATNGSVFLNASGTIGDGTTGDIDILVGTGLDNVVELASGGDITVSLDSSGFGTVDLTGLSTSAGGDTISIDQLNDVALFMDGSGAGYANLDGDDLVIDGGGGFVTFATTPLALDSLALGNSTGTIGIGTTITVTGVNGTLTDGITITTTGQLSGSGQLVSSGGSTGDISLTASNIGSAPDPLGVQTATGTQLNLSTAGAATSGAAYIESSGQALEIGSLSAANANTFSLDNTNGDIIFTTAVNDADIDLSAITNTSGGITFDAGITVEQLFASAADDVTVNAAVATAASTDGTSSGLTIGAGGNLTGTAGSLRTGNADDSVSGDGSPITSGDLLVNVGGTIDNGVSLATGDATDGGISGDTASSGNISLTAASIGSDGNAVTVDFGAASTTTAIGVLNVATTGGAGAGGAFIDAGGTSRLRINNLSTASATNANEFNFINTNNIIEFITGGTYTNVDSVTLDIDATGGSGNLYVNQAGTFGAIDVVVGNAVLLNQGWNTANTTGSNSGDITVTAAQLTGGVGDGFTTGDASANGAVSSGSISITGQVNGNLDFAVGSATDTSGGNAGTVGDVSFTSSIVGAGANSVTVDFGTGDIAGQLNLDSTVGDFYINSSTGLVIGDLDATASLTRFNLGTTSADGITFDSGGTYGTLDSVLLTATATTGGVNFDRSITVDQVTVNAAGDIDLANGITLATSNDTNTGSISLTSSGGTVTSDAGAGNANVVTGNASNAALATSSTSGSITVSANGVLDNSVAYSTGSATDEGNDTATSGSINLSAASIGSSGNPVTVTLGVGSGGLVNNQGVLNLNTSAGDIYISSAADLSLGTVDTAAASADTVDILVTGGNTLTLTSAIDEDTTSTLTGDNFAFNTQTGTFDGSSQAIDLGATGSLAVTADNLVAGSFSGVQEAGGGITLSPFTGGTTIGLGTGTGSFQLSDADLDALVNASGGATGTVTIGNSTAGAVEIVGVTFLADQTLGIVTGSTVNDAGAGTAFSGGNLVITAGAGIGTSSTLNLSAGSLAATVSGPGNIDVTDSGNLYMGNTSLDRGISTADGSISITAAQLFTNAVSGGDLISTDSPTAGSGNVVLTATNGALWLTDSVTLAGSGDSLTLETFDAGAGGANIVTSGGFATSNGAVTMRSADNIFIGGAIGAGTATVTLSANDAGNDSIADAVGAVNGAGLITADTVTATALNGIGNSTAMNFSASTISAVTTTGAIDIDNAATAATTVSSLSTGSGAITFDQTGGQTLDIQAASSTVSGLFITNAGANLTLGSGAGISAAGLVDVDVTGSGNILVGSINAGTNAVQLTAAGAIDDASTDTTLDITGGTVNLAAASGIGGSEALEINSSSLIATVSGAGNIAVNDQGGTTLTTISAANGNVIITSNSNLLVGSVSASGSAAISTTSGSINDASANPDTTADITAATIDLDATTGIGNTADLDLAGATAISADSSAGAINLRHAASAATTVNSLTTSNGQINFFQTGGNTLDIIAALTTGSGAIDIRNEGADLTLTSVTSAGTIDARTGTSGDIFVGSLNAGSNMVTLGSAGAIEDAAVDTTTDIIAGTVKLDAANGIGGASTGGGDVRGAIELDVDTLDTRSTGVGSIVLSEVDSVVISDLTNASGDVDLVAAGAITNSASATLGSSGNTSLTGSSITIGNQAGDSVSFGSLTFNSTGAVAVNEDNATELAGSSTANSLVLNSLGAITNAASASVSVTNNASFVADNGGTAQDITLGSQGGDSINFGTLTFDGAAVTIAEDSAIDLSGTSAANSLDLDSTADIGDNGTANLSVSGNANLADAGGAGILLDDTYNFGNLTFNSTGTVDITEASSMELFSSSTAATLLLDAGGNAITDALGATSTVISGNASLTASSVTLGDDASDTLNLGSVTLSTTGAVAITENSGTRFSGANTVGGALDIIAGGTIDDDGTGSLAVSGTATLEAGAANDITLGRPANDFSTVVITSGNNVTLVDTNGVILGNANVTGLYDVTASGMAINGTISSGTLDFDASGAAGAINQGVGSTVSVTGLATFAAQTTDNITLGQGNDFTSVAVTSGQNVQITDATNGVGLAGVIASGTAQVDSTGGAITDAGNDTAVDIAGTTVTLNATDGDIGGTGENASLDINAATVNATTSDGGSGGGGIYLNNVSGSTVTFNTITAAGTGNDVELLSNASVALGAVTADDQILVNASAGNIDDASDDDLADLTAAGVTLTAGAGDIGGAAPVGVDTRRDIEINADTITLNPADTQLATIHSLGAAPVTVSSTGGGVNIWAAGTIEINSLNAGDNDDVTLYSENGDILDHADDNLADIVANNITLTAANNGNIGGSILGTVTGDDPEHEIEIDPAGTLNLTSDSLFLNDLSGNPVTLSFSGVNFSYSSTDDILVDLINASGTVTLTAGGSINDATAGTGDGVADINGATVTLNASDEIGGLADLEISSSSLFADVDIAGDIVIHDIGGTTLADIDTASGNIDIDSNGTLEVDVVTTNDSGTVDIVTTNGSITDANGTASAVNGTTVTLTATTGIGSGANSINTDADVLDLETTTNGIFISEADGVDLAGVNAAGFTLTAAGNVTDSAALVVTGTTSISAGAANNVTLDVGTNDFGTFRVLSGNVVDVVDTNGITLGTSTTSGEFGVLATSINQTGALTVGGLDLDSTGIINLSNTIDSTAAIAIDAAGLTTVNAAGDISSDGSISFGATRTGTLSLAGDLTTEGATIDFNRAVSLGGVVTINSVGGSGAGGNVNFDSTLNGSTALTVQAGTGNVTFSGNAGSGVALGTLTVSGNNILVNGNLTTSAGSQALITNSGVLTLSNSSVINVGGGLTQSGSGSVSLGANITSTGDNISFGSSVSLTDNVDLSTGTTAIVRFGSGLTGAGRDLTVSAGSSAGSVRFDGSLSGVDVLSIVAGGADVNADISANSISFAGVSDLAGNVDLTSAGAMSLGGALTLSGGATTTSVLTSGSDASITIGGAVNSSNGQSLTVRSQGGFGFTTINLGAGDADLQVDNDGDTNFSVMNGTSVTAASVVLAGGADGNDRISVGSVSSTAGDVTINSAMQLGATLAINSAADVTLSQLLTGVTGAGLQVDNAGVFNANSDIVLTDADITLNGTVGFTGTRTFSAGSGSISLADVTSGGTLDLDGSGGLILGGAVSVGALDNTGMSGALLVSGSASVSTPGSVIDLTTFSGIDATGSGSLALNAGAADVLLPAIGRNLALDDLSVTASQASIGDVSTSGGQVYNSDISLSGELLSGTEIVVNGNMLLAGSSSITGSAVTVNGDIDGAQALSISGDVDVSGGVGQETALESLTVSGTAANFGSAITTDGVQTFNSSVAIGGNLTGRSVIFNNSVDFPSGSVIVSDTIDFNGGTSSVSGSGELTLVPATDGASIGIGTGGDLTINGDALTGYDAGLVIGGTRSIATNGRYDIDIVASDIIVNSGIDTGTGSLTLLSRSGIDLRNGVLRAGQLVLVASDGQGTILNNGGQNTQLISDEIVLVAGSNIGLQGQEIRARAESGQGILQIASGAEESAISDPTNSLEQLIGNEGAIAAAIVSSLGISINQNLLVTNAAQSSANREQTGGLTDEGFIDPSLFEDISLYEVLGSGIALPADQSEEGYFEEEGDDCNPEFEDCGSAAAPGAFMPY